LGRGGVVAALEDLALPLSGMERCIDVLTAAYRWLHAEDFLLGVLDHDQR